MTRQTSTLTILTFFLTMTPLVLSQTGAARPCPDVMPGTLGCQLVQWSQLQAPVPLPEPTAKAVPPHDDGNPLRSNSATAQPQTPQQVIVGMIVRDGTRYVLKAGDRETYPLDGQNDASQLKDRKIKV